MPQSPGFKLCVACSKPMSVSDLHLSCLKCLREAHTDKCKICRGFRPRTQKGRDICLKALLMDAALRQSSEPCCSVSVPSSSASVWSAPLALSFSQHYSPFLVLRRNARNRTLEEGTL